MGLLRQNGSSDLRAPKNNLGPLYNPDQGPSLDQPFSLEKNWLGELAPSKADELGAEDEKLRWRSFPEAPCGPGSQGMSSGTDLP